MRHIGEDLTFYQYNFDNHTSLSLDTLACAGGNTDMNFIETGNENMNCVRRGKHKANLAL
jgi:hypothetical protein